jgi:hydroxymethylpyrimidine pyrophosphatase-like HAD family hydrolase
MRFRVLALDYDGTIAHHGELHPGVRSAINEARAQGIAVILVTGRILQDLRRVAGDLDLFDAVVAENGAVLAFPGKGRTMPLTHPMPPILIEKLRQRDIQAVSGECIIEADAGHAERILGIIRELELPLVIAFNRSRLMVLPHSISKATGLNKALSALRLSAHNAIAIGDAENDHAMLDLCEIGLAVQWGSAALKAVADEVLEGNGAGAIADYIRRISADPRLPKVHRRRQLHLGVSRDGQRLDLEVSGRNILITGDSGSGKSWVAGLLCEQLILQGYSVCVIDPEGEYSPLESLPGVVVFSEECEPHFGNLERVFRYPESSVVVDLLKMSPGKRLEYVPTLLKMLGALRRQTGLPHRIFVDEAHYFLNGPEAHHVLDLDMASYTLVTYQAARLDPSVLQASEAIIITRNSDSAEVSHLHSLLGGQRLDSEWQAILGTLAANEAALLPCTDESKCMLRSFRISPRLTSHVRHRHKYLDAPVSPERAFVFTLQDVPTGRGANSLAEFITLVAACPSEILKNHMQRHDFSRWIRDVFRDFKLASQIHELEMQQHLMSDSEIKVSLKKLIWERYLPPNPSVLDKD